MMPKFALSMLVALAVCAPLQEAAAQESTLGGALFGGAAGAIVGGALGGGRGAAVGAIVGATTGAAIGGFIIAFIEVFAAHLGLARWSEVAVFTVLILVLVFRPSGILGQALGERA